MSVFLPSEEEKCVFCQQKMIVAPIAGRPELLYSCVPMPVFPSKLAPEPYHRFNYSWNSITEKVVRVGFSFVFNGRKIHCAVWYNKGTTAVVDEHGIVFDIPRIIEPDFPKLISFQEKIKKLMVFA
jgi:hypothetical protein